MCVCLSLCVYLCVCVYLSVNSYLLFILVKSGPWEQGHPSCPWVYQRERKKERIAKGIENIVPLRAARRENISNRSYRCLPLGIKASVAGKTTGSSPGESKLDMPPLPQSVFAGRFQVRIGDDLLSICHLLFVLLLVPAVVLIWSRIQNQKHDYRGSSAGLYTRLPLHCSADLTHPTSDVRISPAPHFCSKPLSLSGPGSRAKLQAPSVTACSDRLVTC